MLHVLIGPSIEPAHLTALQVGLRGVSVLGCAALAGEAARRFPSKEAPLDLVLGVSLGWTLSWAINSPSPLVTILAFSILLLLVYRLIRRIVFPGRRLNEGAHSGEAAAVVSDPSGRIGVHVLD